MLPKNILTDITNLPLEKLKYISYTKKIFNEKVILEITFQGKGKYKQCPCCGQKTKKRYDSAFYSQNNIRHQIHFSYDIRLRILKRRFICKKCGNVFIEPFDFIPRTDSRGKAGSRQEDRHKQKSRSKSHTKHFENYILFEWHHLTVSEIARRCSVSEYRIWKIISDIDIKELLEKGKQIMLNQQGDLYLGIDEHSFSGRDMVLVITEHSSKKVVAVLPDVRKETLKNWLNSLPPSVMVRIKGLTIDMTGTYKNTVLETLGTQVSAITDKYHIIQMANNAMDEIRKMNSWMIHSGIYGHNLIDLRQRKGIRKKDVSENKRSKGRKGKAEKEENGKNGKNEKGEGKDGKEKEEKEKIKNYKGCSAFQRVSLKNFKKYRELSGANDLKIKTYNPGDPSFKAITIHHFLSQAYRTLFLKREDNLTYRQKQRLNQILTEFDPQSHVSEAYIAKEMIIEMMDEKNEKLLNETIEFLKDCEHYKLQELYRSLIRWKTEIINYFRYGKTNARNEGYNNKAKILKRISYGYNTKKNYIKKLMFAL